MNTKLLNEVKDIINLGNIPAEHKLFAGAGLIVQTEQINDPVEGKLYICSEFACQISWLVFQLKEVFKDEIDYLYISLN